LQAAPADQSINLICTTCVLDAWLTARDDITAIDVANAAVELRVEMGSADLPEIGSPAVS